MFKKFKKSILMGILALGTLFVASNGQALANGETYTKYHYGYIGGISIEGQSAGVVTDCCGYGDAWGYSQTSATIDGVAATNYIYYAGSLKYSKTDSGVDRSYSFADSDDYPGAPGNFKSKTFHDFYNNGEEIYFYTQYSF